MINPKAQPTLTEIKLIYNRLARSKTKRNRVELSQKQHHHGFGISDSQSGIQRERLPS